MIFIKFILPLFLALLVFLPNAFAQESKNLSFSNPEVREAYIDIIRNTILENDEASVGRELARKMPGAETMGIDKGFFQFESDILDLIHLGRTSDESFLELCALWGFSTDEAFDITAYYTTRIFDEKTTLDQRQLFKRLAEISLQRYIREHADEYDYYQRNLTQKNIPEMAAEMGLHDHEIYERLAAFRLSIMAAYNRKPTLAELEALPAFLESNHLGDVRIGEKWGILDLAKYLSRKALFKQPVFEKLREIFHFGPNAWIDALHAANIFRRRMTWDRSAQYDGELLTEGEILARLASRSLSREEMILSLNRIFKDQPRSEGNIASQLLKLNLVEPKASAMDDLYDPNYGYLVKSKHFVATAVFQFLADHPNQSREWFAAQLGAKPYALDAFIRRHKLGFMFGEPVRAEPQLLAYRERIRIFEAVLQHIQDHGPLYSGIEAMEAAHLHPDFLTTNGYLPQRKKLGFETQAIFLEKLRAYGEERGIFVSYAHLHKLELISNAQLKSDALHEMFDYYVANDYQFGKVGTYPIAYNRLVSVYQYAPNQPQDGLGIFSSPKEFFLAFKSYAADRGVDFKILSKQYLDDDEDLRPIWQQEAIELAYDWVVTHNGQLFKTGEAQEALKYCNNSRLVSATNYAPGSPQHRFHIFENRLQFLIRLRDYLKASGQPTEGISFRKIRYENLSDEEKLLLPQLQQEEALEILDDWQNAHPDLTLTKATFTRTKPPGILAWPILAGVGDYAPGKKNEARRIFDSPEHLRERFEKYRAKQPCGSLLQNWPLRILPE